MDQLVHDTQTERLLGAFDLAREDDVEGRAGANQPGEPLAAARPRENAELHFREAELGPGVIGGHAVPAGEGELEPAAEDRKSIRLNSSHSQISYAVFCLKKKKKTIEKKLRAHVLTVVTLQSPIMLNARIDTKVTYNQAHCIDVSNSVSVYTIVRLIRLCS